MEFFYNEIVLMEKKLVFGPFDLKDVYFSSILYKTVENSSDSNLITF